MSSIEHDRMMSSRGGSDGPATDRFNAPVIDPTKNVLDLVQAAVLRQDDLRIAGERHTAEMRVMRRHYEERLQKAESDRIDAIRAVDVAAVQQAAQAAEARATALAAQVAASAEAMRVQVAAAAQAAATSLAAALEPIIKDIADLRRNMYEQQGQKQQVVESRDSGGAIGAWVGLAVGVAALLVSVVVAAVTIALTVR
jgi:hypothetical protein